MPTARNCLRIVRYEREDFRMGYIHLGSQPGDPRIMLECGHPLPPQAAPRQPYEDYWTWPACECPECAAIQPEQKPEPLPRAQREKIAETICRQVAERRGQVGPKDPLLDV